MGKDLLAELSFVSSSEQTLPSKETILNAIDRSFPRGYSITNHVASRNRSFIETIKISYDVCKVAPNRYKISLYDNRVPGLLGIILVVACLLVGGFIGYLIFNALGALIGGLALFFIVGNAMKNDEITQTCNYVCDEMKEFERAHLLNSSNSSSR